MGCSARTSAPPLAIRNTATTFRGQSMPFSTPASQHLPALVSDTHSTCLISTEVSTMLLSLDGRALAVLELEWSVRFGTSRPKKSSSMLRARQFKRPTAVSSRIPHLSILFELRQCFRTLLSTCLGSVFHLRSFPAVFSSMLHLDVLTRF